MLIDWLFVENETLFTIVQTGNRDCLKPLASITNWFLVTGVTCFSNSFFYFCHFNIEQGFKLSTDEVSCLYVLNINFYRVGKGLDCVFEYFY